MEQHSLSQAAREKCVGMCFQTQHQSVFTHHRQQHRQKGTGSSASNSGCSRCTEHPPRRIQGSEHGKHTSETRIYWLHVTGNHRQRSQPLCQRILEKQRRVGVIEEATGHCPWPTHQDRAHHWHPEPARPWMSTNSTQKLLTRVQQEGSGALTIPLLTVARTAHKADGSPQTNRSLFWPKSTGQITLQTNGNWRTHERTPPKPAGTRHPRPGWEQWHGGHTALLPSGAAGSGGGRHTQAEGWSSWVMTRENWTQRGKKWPATNQVWLGRCVSLQQTQSPARGWQRCWNCEIDRWNGEPLTLTTQKGGSVLENTQISQTHNRKINISMGYDLHANS